jgi:hypothetical protein
MPKIYNIKINRYITIAKKKSSVGGLWDDADGKIQKR